MVIVNSIPWSGIGDLNTIEAEQAITKELDGVNVDMVCGLWTSYLNAIRGSPEGTTDETLR